MTIVIWNQARRRVHGTYGENSISTLLAHYGIDRPAEKLQGEEMVKEATISPEITTEWKTSISL